MRQPAELWIQKQRALGGFWQTGGGGWGTRLRPQNATFTRPTWCCQGSFNCCKWPGLALEVAGVCQGGIWGDSGVTPGFGANSWTPVDASWNGVLLLQRCRTRLSLPACDYQRSLGTCNKLAEHEPGALQVPSYQGYLPILFYSDSNPIIISGFLAMQEFTSPYSVHV